MKPELERMTKAELYSQAQKHAIPGRSKMGKAALIKALTALTQETEPGRTDNPSSVPEVYIPEIPKAVGASEAISISSPRPTPGAPQYMTPPPAGDYVGEEGPPLPSRLPATALKAMARDPYWVFVYWEISPEREAEIRSKYGDWVFHQSLSVLRIHEMDGGTHRDLPVLLDSRNWYLPVKPDQHYTFELGLVLADGQFASIVSSDEICVPAAQPSFQDEEEWLTIVERYRKLADVYGDLSPETVGSSENLHRVITRQSQRFGWSGALTISSGDLQSR